MKWFRTLLTRITIEHIWVIVVLAGIITFLNTHPIRPHDYWFHIAVGQDILESGSIPVTDYFSYTQYGMPYHSYQQFWLMEVILYAVYFVGGPTLTILFQTFFVSGAYILLTWICYRLSKNWRAVAFSLIFAASIGFGNWNVRPQTISYFLGAIILLGITEYRISNRRIWFFLFPITMVLWVNSHGSFPIGLAFLGIWLSDVSWKIFLGWFKTRKWDYQKLYSPMFSLLISVLACFVNPRGLGFVNYLSQMTGNSIVQNFILEWKPPDFNSLEGIIFYIAFMGSILVMMVSPKRPSFSQLITFLIFGVLGLKYIRGIIWYGITMAPYVAVHLSAIITQIGLKPAEKPNERLRTINSVFVVSMVVLIFLSLPWFKQYWPVIPEKKGLISLETPIEATNYILDNNLPSNLFHDMGFGSYLVWAAYPRYKVFVDSRIELFPVEIWDDYLTISNASGDWEGLLRNYQINTLLLEPSSQARLIDAVRKLSGWELVYQDQAAVIFTRKVTE